MPQPDSIRLSVIMPVYNEEGAIALAVAEVQRDVLDLVPNSELIVVNDGSRDGTGAILDRAAMQDARVMVVHKPNGGHGSALIAGLAKAQGEHLFLIDSDMQIPLNDFKLAWRHMLDGSDAVFGIRRRRFDPAFRLYLSAFIRHSVNTMFGVRLRDANVPYKLFRRVIWLDAHPWIPDDTLAPSLFLAVIAKSRGYKIVEFDVVHKERDTGEVSLKRMKLMKFCARALSQLLTLRSRVR